jgi:hypothetical protein
MAMFATGVVAPGYVCEPGVLFGSKVLGMNGE